jgi:hypothetical protein
MSRLKYNIIYEQNGKVPVSATVFRRGKFYIATQDHPNFNEIVEALNSEKPGPEVIGLFDTGSLLVKGFRLAAKAIKAMANAATPDEVAAAVANDVTVRNGVLYYKDEPMHGVLAETILGLYDQKKSEAFVPLARFLSKVMDNPNPHSRVHLYDWMKHLSFNIDEDGNLIAYKGVNRHWDHGFVSVHTGPAIAAGIKVTGHVPNKVGTVVRMDRKKVTFDPQQGCGSGLHVGTVSFARSYGNAMIEVKIDPRDVVSVPTEHDWQKLRVCKYKVLREVTGKEVILLSKQRVIA